MSGTTPPRAPLNLLGVNHPEATQVSENPCLFRALVPDRACLRAGELAEVHGLWSGLAHAGEEAISIGTASTAMTPFAPLIVGEVTETGGVAVGFLAGGHVGSLGFVQRQPLHDRWLPVPKIPRPPVSPPDARNFLQRDAHVLGDRDLQPCLNGRRNPSLHAEILAGYKVPYGVSAG